MKQPPATDYANFLRDKVFRTENYLQFELLFEAIDKLNFDADEAVVLLERSFIYNGSSIFAGLIAADNVTVLDYRPENAADRVGYQSAWLVDSGYSYQVAEGGVFDTGNGYQFDLPDGPMDSLLIPNILHHCRDFPELIKGVLDRRPGLRRVFVFDSYLRENHQEPDDYCRYTPSALSAVLCPLGFQVESKQEIGNVFDGILYLLEQAKDNLQRPELADLNALVEGQLKPRLKSIRSDQAYRSLGRPYATLATAYAMTFTRELET